MSMECQVNVKSQSELDIGGRETCMGSKSVLMQRNRKERSGVPSGPSPKFKGTYP